MRVLVIGSGAREHALLLALSRDPSVTGLFCAPGNAGTARIAEQHQVDVASGAAVVALAREVAADLVVIGPEVPLVLGVADAVRAAGIACFGPSADAARIEGSKAFAKDVMAAAGVRTAHSEVVDNPAELDAALDRFGPNWVVKDDGLAAGKGVVVTTDRSAARDHAAELLENGHPVLLESFLDGPEVSLFCLVDGETVVPLLPAQDHKRVGDGDAGPNTGGMGAYTPLPWLPDAMVQQIVDEVAQPVATEMSRRGCPFSGLLYAGLAIGSSGPAVVEFNCRFGDPETQAVLALLESPLGELLEATATGKLAEVAPLRWQDGAAVTVVLAAENYPGRPRLGDVISGGEAEGVLHAGTARNDEGALVSAGGRVLSVVGTGTDLAAARAQAYERLAGIKLPGGHFRSDIGLAAEQGRISIPTQGVTTVSSVSGTTESVPIIQIDAFADALFEGNPAAVMPLPHWPADELLQRIAAENNLSETAFLVAALPDGVTAPEPGCPAYHLRWFTPSIEVDLCGHATLAAASYLLDSVHSAANRVQLWTRSGWLHVDRAVDDGPRGGFTMDLPAVPLAATGIDPVVASALGAAVVEAHAGMDLVYVLDDAAAVRDLTPDLAVLAGLDARGVVVTAGGQRTGFDFVCRWFGSRAGVSEDPVTGSAFAQIAPLWARRLGKAALVGRQLSARGGTVRCRVVDGARVELTGNCIRFSEGVAAVPGLA